MAKNTLQTGELQTDIVIFGGGIAGLWLLNRVRSCGYHAVLLEKDTLGGVQTLASQGMIHGGQKYTLTGKASKHAVNIAKMPDVWAKCFDGTGEIDLSGVNMLSDSQIMWAMPGMASGVGVFAASKAVNANTTRLSGNDVPKVLSLGDGFKGKAYRLDECVLDIKALVEALADPHMEYIYRAELQTIHEIEDGVLLVVKDEDHRDIKITTKVAIFTAGTGNEKVLENLGAEKQLTQRRPLKQVMARGLNYPLYGHCIAASPKPRVTITSHPIDDKNYVWYLGGAVAETSVKRGDLEAMVFAKNEMEDMFPKIDWDAVEWAVLAVDRAEPYDKTGYLPHEPYIMEYGSVLVAWPTKLTFAPGLGEKICGWLKDKDVRATVEDESVLPLPQAQIGTYPWETAKWQKL